MKCPVCDGKGEIKNEFTKYMESCGQLQSEEQTNFQFMQICTMDELAGAIYDWYSTGHIEGKHGKKLSSITPIVEWLKEVHHE